MTTQQGCIHGSIATLCPKCPSLTVKKRKALDSPSESNEEESLGSQEISEEDSDYPLPLAEMQAIFERRLETFFQQDMPLIAQDCVTQYYKQQCQATSFTQRDMSQIPNERKPLAPIISKPPRKRII